MDAQLTASAVAERVGVSRATIYAYRRDGKMPDPDGHVGRTPWWSVTTIDRWNATRRKVRGRPPKDR